MSQSSKQSFPNWFEEEPPQKSYRSLFKWGKADEFKHPNKGMFKLMKNVFQLEDLDFRTPQNLGLENINVEIPPQIASVHLEAFKRIVGNENYSGDTYSRVKASYGKGMIDLLRLRNKIIENIPDAVLRPRDENDIEKIVNYCNQYQIPLYMLGGGSTVTRGTEAVKGGVTIDLSAHLNQVVSFNETDQTITVQAGMYGPALEKILNHAQESLSAKRAYTCGHFPQSFEYSSVGGWVVTRGAGQNSTYYGKIEDIVLSQEYITPRGKIKTGNFPRCSTGPDLNQIFMGSEGTFGVLINVTLKIFRFMPENRKYFSFMFKNWDAALDACREMLQSESGFPSVFRLSDPEETDVALKMYGIGDTIAEKALNALGYKPMERCLLLGLVDGDSKYTNIVVRNVRKVARRYSVFELSAFQVTHAWEKSRFTDPYLRDDLQDYGILTDTLECAVTWSKMKEVHQFVRAYIKSRPNLICMTHLSHAYPQGGNLYFIFIAKMDAIEDYLELQYGILEMIGKSGAAISHHHGIGKQTAPWLVEYLGSDAYGVLKALKGYFDPNQIMNPGGTLGFDMSEEQKNKLWSKNLNRIQNG